MIRTMANFPIYELTTEVHVQSLRQMGYVYTDTKISKLRNGISEIIRHESPSNASLEAKKVFHRLVK